MDSFGERLKYLRNKAGLSQAELADKLKCTQQAIQRAEAGLSRQPRFAHEAAQLLNSTFDWLVYGSGDVSQSYEQISSQGFKASEKPRSVEKDLPILATSSGGSNDHYFLTGDVSEFIQRPPQLVGVKGAYALYVYNKTLEPRYYEGEIVYAHPVKPVRDGDYICLKFADPENPDMELIDIFQLTAKDHTGVCLVKPGLTREIVMEMKDIKAIDKIVFASATT